MNKYLKPESAYNDRYDLHTIEECLRITKHWQSLLTEKQVGDFSEEDKKRAVSIGFNLQMWHFKGERYKERSLTISDWMASDRSRDEKLEKTPEPQGVTCPNCSKRMGVIHKDLYDWDNGPLRVLFMFECSSCNKRRAIFDDGQGYVSKPQLCPKCNSKLNVSYKEKGRIGTWLNKCSSCDFTEKEVDDLDKIEGERKARELEEQGLLQKHRAEFCMSSAEGEEYNESLRRMEDIKVLLDKAKLKKDDPDYQKVAKINKWTVIELEKKLSAALDKEKYQKLMFDKPEIDKYVIVPFTLQDADATRKEGDSKRKLQRYIKKALEGTNWRLMSAGVSYRLGYLSGQLKGYEREEDLLQIVKQDKSGARG